MIKYITTNYKCFHEIVMYLLQYTTKYKANAL